MDRRHDLDWVRVLAFGVLVLYHVGMYYVSWGWHVKSPQAGPALEPLMLLSAPWRLGLLFLVSGAATAFLLQRRPEGFLRSRSTRLLVPLAFGVLVVVAPQAYYEVVEQLPGGYEDGFWAFYLRYLSADDGFCRGSECLVLPTWNHLWFVAYLWVYTLVLWAAMALLPPSAHARLRAATGRLLSGAGLLVWPTALLAIARIALLDRFDSTHALVDDWYNHAQYLPLFLLGFAMARMDDVWRDLWRLRRLSLGLAAGSYVALIVYLYGVGFDADHPPPPLLRSAMRGAWALNQWSAIAAFLGYAWRLRGADGPLLRYLVPAVFPVYILHQTFIVVLAHHLKPAALPPLFEGSLLIVATFGACFACYEVIRRIGPLRPLFGLPRAPRTQAPGIGTPGTPVARG